MIKTQSHKAQWKKRLGLALIILIFSAVSVFSVSPFIYGIFNQAVVIPFLKDTINPELYPGDYLLNEKVYYATYLWSLLAFIVRSTAIELPLLFFGCYFIAIYFSFLAIYWLAMLLFKRSDVAVLTLFFFLFGNKDALGFTFIYGSTFIEKLAALPLQLFVLYFYLKGRFVIAFGLLGLAFLIHPLTSVYIAAMLLVASLVNLKHIGFGKLMFYGLIMALVAGPVIVFKFFNAPPGASLFYADPQWVELLRLRSAHHLFPLTWSKDDFFRMGLVLMVFFISWKYKPASKQHRIITVWLATILFLWLMGTLFAEVLPVAIVIQLQLFRSSVFILPFAMFYFANYFLMTMQSDQDSFIKLAITFVALGLFYEAPYEQFAVVSFFGVAILMLFYYYWRSRENPMPSRYFVPLLLVVVLLLGVGIYVIDRSFSLVNGADEKWLAVQYWAKENTPLEVMFIVPPHSSGFRIESERAIYGDWKDGTQMFFNPAYGREWIRRMTALGYDEAMEIENFDNTDKLIAAFQTLSEADFMRISREIDGTTYLVMYATRKPLNFPLVYESEQFKIYEIKS